MIPSTKPKSAPRSLPPATPAAADAIIMISITTPATL